MDSLVVGVNKGSVGLGNGRSMVMNYGFVVSVNFKNILHK
jgi:hypothetical protein